MDLAERDAALLAPPGLLGRAFPAEAVMDLVEVAPPEGRVPLVGHGLRRRHEPHHLGSHRLSQRSIGPRGRRSGLSGLWPRAGTAATGRVATSPITPAKIGSPAL